MSTKLVSLGTRVTADIKNKLIAAALESGRTMTAEAAHRLEQSFAQQTAQKNVEQMARLMACSLPINYRENPCLSMNAEIISRLEREFAKEDATRAEAIRAVWSWVETAA